MLVVQVGAHHRAVSLAERNRMLWSAATAGAAAAAPQPGAARPHTFPGKRPIAQIIARIDRSGSERDSSGGEQEEEELATWEARISYTLWRALDWAREPVEKVTQPSMFINSPLVNLNFCVVVSHTQMFGRSISR